MDLSRKVASSFTRGVRSPLKIREETQGRLAFPGVREEIGEAGFGHELVQQNERVEGGGRRGLVSLLGPQGPSFLFSDAGGEFLSVG